MSEDRRFAVFWMTHREPTRAADYIIELEAKLETERARVRVLRDAVSKAVADYDSDCQHYSSTTGGMYRGSPTWIVPARQALATTAPEAGEDGE